MKTRIYDREAALRYAEQWALKRNPAYYNFDSLGGDCTNFVSQCVYAGAGIMNDTPELGWYYVNLNNRAPAWTGVQAFFRFFTTNSGPGPVARIASRSALLPGDVIQLGNGSGDYYHTLFVLSNLDQRIYVAAHTNDALWRPLDSYSYSMIRFLHIDQIKP